jgi:hypothetical protein
MMTADLNEEKQTPNDEIGIQIENIPEWANDFPGGSSRGGENIRMLCKKTLKSPEEVIEWIKAVARKNGPDMGPGDVYAYIGKKPDMAIKSLLNYYEKPDPDEGENKDTEPTHTEKNEEAMEHESIQTDEEIVKEFNYMSPEKFRNYVLDNPSKAKNASSIVWKKLNEKWQRQMPSEDFPYSHHNLPRYLRKETTPVKSKEKKSEPELDENKESQPSENNEDLSVASDIEKDRSGRWKIRLLHMRTEYPKEAESARIELGFGHLVMSEDAAEKWVKCILEKVKSKMNGKK